MNPLLLLGLGLGAYMIAKNYSASTGTNYPAPGTNTALDSRIFTVALAFPTGTRTVSVTSLASNPPTVTITAAADVPAYATVTTYGPGGAPTYQYFNTAGVEIADPYAVASNPARRRRRANPGRSYEKY